MDMWVHEIDNMKYGLHVKTKRKKKERKKEICRYFVMPKIICQK